MRNIAAAADTPGRIGRGGGRARRSWDFMKPSSGLSKLFEAAGRLAETTEPLASSSELVPALDEVGRGYEQGRLFCRSFS